MSDDELARLREAHARTSRALDAAVAEARRERERADAAVTRAAVLRKKLEAARGSVSFRLGRATRVALDTGDPRRWLRTFRGDDEILDDLADDPADDVRAETPLDPEVVLAGAAVDPSPLAVLEGSALQARTLTPHGWRAELELRPASLVIVTGDVLASGTPWGDWGTPGGRDGRALLGELVAWCRARGIAVAYWGAPPVPALPFDLIVPA